MNIGICILATNRYFLLGLRFIQKWRLHHKGDKNVTFYLFTDNDPSNYINTDDVVYVHSENSTWVEGVNSKFSNILKLKNVEEDYLFFFDADTNITKDFDESWFLGDRVGGQHFGDQDWMKQVKGYDRNPSSSAYVPYDTNLPQMYYYGAFFGGSKKEMLSLCRKILKAQEDNRKIGYEPGVNDESYLNREYHYNPPTKVVLCPDFSFVISDKGSIDNMRDVNADYSKELFLLKDNYNTPFDVIGGVIKFI
jgi:hypothetical protein